MGNEQRHLDIEIADVLARIYGDDSRLCLAARASIERIRARAKGLRTKAT